ncbi:STAS domain-containing protein [uncultured Roseobacter sp.]|uniref:STAS domain-containing protein n=1 Tax=uncultured Roseobacter sp. TaxID=114847 RepID=UPI00262CAF14|nr:STAS domain-containing protein [uncultured Roseobacter sp.]
MSEPLIAESKLDLSAASDLATALKSRAGEDLTVDLSKVKHLGALCLQVFLSAATSANASGHRISFVNASDRVIDQLRVMGMTPETISGGRQ